MSKNLLGSDKPEVVMSALLAGARGKTFIEKTWSKARKVFDWPKLRQLPHLGKTPWLFVFVFSI